MSMPILSSVTGLLGTWSQVQGAKAKKRALNKAEQNYYDALTARNAGEVAMGRDEVAQLRAHTAPRNAALGTLVDGYTGAQPAADGFQGQLANTIDQAGSSVQGPEASSWAYSGLPAEGVAGRQQALTDSRRSQLMDSMLAAHHAQSRADVRTGMLANYSDQLMPMNTDLTNLTRLYDTGRAARDVDWQKHNMQLQLALRHAGQVGDRQLAMGAYVTAAGGAAGSLDGYGGGSSGSSPSGEVGQSGGEMNQSAGVSPYAGW